MKNTLILLIFLTFGLFSNAQTGGLFYYVFDEVVPLTPVPNKFCVEFVQDVDETVFLNNNLIYTKISKNLYEVEASYTDIQNVGSEVFKINQLYINENGVEIRMKNSIVLQWKDSISESERNSLIAQYGLVEEKTTRLFSIYGVDSPLLMSQLIYESDLVTYCEPNIIAVVEKSSYIPNDEYFDKQFYLHNTGQENNDGHFGTIDADIDAPEAWDITLGSPDIIVAVVDEGVTADHPDLPNSRQLRLPFSNIAAQYDDSDPHNPEPTGNENHGNACAGVIAASMDNEQGITGIAPECVIMPVKVRYIAGLTFSDFAWTTTFAVNNGAHIISNSWNTFLNSATINVAIEDAISQGVYVVFSAGNTGNNVMPPADEGIQGLITVGATDRNDTKAGYSPTDHWIDIVAPSHSDFTCDDPNEGGNVWTLDIPGEAGYNHFHYDPLDPECQIPPSGDSEEVLPSEGIDHFSYCGRFGGTSAAAPQVAAVIALMLSVNPSLSYDQTLDILYNTAEKVGGYNYITDQDNPEYSMSEETGHGRLNAFYAVQAAQNIYSKNIDLYIKDTPSDFGVEPNESEEQMWKSSDIWVRNQQDGFTNQVHQNPEFSFSDPCYVYVKVRNIGSNSSNGNERVRLYWSKAATAMAWPVFWNGSLTSPALMGDQIGFQIMDVIESGGERIFEFEWEMPNPDIYESVDMDEPWHFCLLSRITATSDPMADEMSSGSWNLPPNVRNNNNIAWKNVSIVNVIAGMAGGGYEDDKLIGASVAVGNATNSPGIFDLRFSVPKNDLNLPITSTSEVRVTLDDITWQKWNEGGREGEHIKVYREERNQLIIENSDATIKNLSFAPLERGLISLSFNFLTSELSGKTSFYYDIIQTESITGEVLGGESYKISVPERDSFEAHAGDDMEVVKNDNIQLEAQEINEDAIYNWYDPNGNLIHTGKNLTVTPEITKKYKLEVISELDGFKDYDDIEIKVKLAEILNISPNPATNIINIEYDAQNVNSAYVMMSMPFSGTSENFVLDVSNNQVLVDVSSFPSGAYSLILVADGQVVDQKALLLE